MASTAAVRDRLHAEHDALASAVIDVFGDDAERVLSAAGALYATSLRPYRDCVDQAVADALRCGYGTRRARC